MHKFISTYPVFLINFNWIFTVEDCSPSKLQAWVDIEFLRQPVISVGSDNLPTTNTVLV